MFLKQDFVRMLTQRDKGIIQQYILFGVPQKSFYVTHVFLGVITLLIQLAIFIIFANIL